MTHAEIEALKALCDAATPGPWVVEHGYVRQANGQDIPKTDDDVAFAAAARTAVPALLSALEEARNFGRAQDEKAHRFLEERNGAREALVDAESALEEARARTEEMEKSKWYERDRRKEAESRADALQARCDEWEQAARAAAYSEATLIKSVAQESARADAAWRAALEAAAVHVENYEGDFLARTDNIVEEIRALPPPSATPNEETT